MLNQILAQVLPVLVDTLTATLIVLIYALVYRWTGVQIEWTGVQIEQKHMLALQSALQNGGRLGLSPGKSVEDAIDYVQRSVPDALEAFDAVDRNRIAELLEPHMATPPKATDGR